jgi:hypothetical protein
MKKLLLLFVISLSVIACDRYHLDFDDEIVSKNYTGWLDENPEDGASLGTISASSSYFRINFEILTQDPEDAMRVDEKDGELFVNDASKFDFETDSTITADVRISNEENADTIKVLLTLIDVQE